MGEQRGRYKFDKYRNIIMFLSNLLSFLPLKIRKKIFSSTRNTNGLIGIGLRYIILNSIAKKCGDNVLIQPGVYIFSPENLSLGDNISIHPMCYIDATGGITIEDDVSIAHSTTILSSTHTFREMSIPIKDQPVELKETHLMRNIWIGCKTTILSGVTVKTGSIIGANSLVNKDIEEFQIMGGVPVRKISERNY